METAERPVGEAKNRNFKKGLQLGFWRVIVSVSVRERLSVMMMTDLPGSSMAEDVERDAARSTEDEEEEGGALQEEWLVRGDPPSNIKVRLLFGGYLLNSQCIFHKTRKYKK